MTTPNIEELRKLAEAATPGPWAFGTFHRLLVVQADKHGYADKHSAIADIGAGSIPWDATAESMHEYNDAEYIAAANPAAVITLLDQLQSQAERIKELEEEIGGWHEDQKENIGVAFALQREVNKITSERDELREKYTDTYWALDDAARENTSLRAQLDAIAATEPVAYRWVWKSKPHDIEGWCYTSTPPNSPELQEIEKLFTRPMPAQDVTELVELLEFMWRDVSMNEYAFEKLEAALSKYKGSK